METEETRREAEFQLQEKPREIPKAHKRLAIGNFYRVICYLGQRRD